MLRYLLVARFHTSQEAYSAADELLRVMMSVWQAENMLKRLHARQYSIYLHPRRRPIEERLHNAYQGSTMWSSLHWYTFDRDVFRLTHVVDRWVFVHTEYSVFQPFQQILEQCGAAWVLCSAYEDAQPPRLWLNAVASAVSDEQGYAAAEQVKGAFAGQGQTRQMELYQLAQPEFAGDGRPHVQYYPSLKELHIRRLHQYKPWNGLRLMLSFLRYSGFQRIQIDMSHQSAEVP